jgi:transcription termination factor NusB
MSDETTRTIALAIVGVCSLLIKEYFDMRRGQIAAQKAEEVKRVLAVNTIASNEKLEVVANKVEEVHKATNSMKDQLVATTEAEALARGVLKEKTRADEERKV